MKVCEICGNEIYTNDGDNRCNDCEDAPRITKKRKQARIDKDDIMRSLGLTKVKGAMGGTYWE